jgi:hypothetical protein
MTPAQARQFARRWRLATAAELKELRNTPVRIKFRQLCALMAMAHQLDWDEKDPAEDARVCERWQRLRKIYGV